MRIIPPDSPPAQPDILARLNGCPGCGRRHRDGDPVFRCSVTVGTELVWFQACGPCGRKIEDGEPEISDKIAQGAAQIVRLALEPAEGAA